MYVDSFSTDHKLMMEDGMPMAANPLLKLNTPSPLYNFPFPVSQADKTIKEAAGTKSLIRSDKYKLESEK